MKKYTERLHVVFSSLRKIVVLSLLICFGCDIVNAQNELNVINNNWLKYSDAPKLIVSLSYRAGF